MEKTANADEDDNIDNDDKTAERKANKRRAVSAYKPWNSRKRKNCRKRNILQRDESIRKEEVRGNNFQINMTFLLLLLQFAKIGLIAGGRQGSEETIVSLSGVLETHMEEEDDSEEEQDCEHRKKNEETSFSNDNNCVSQAGDIIKHADDDKEYIIVDHNRWKYEFEIKI